MARPTSFNDFEINKFAGLDLRGPSELQPEKTLSKCQNFEIGLLGELRKRPGFVMQHTGATLGVGAANGVKLLGEISNSNYHQILAQNDQSSGSGKIYQSSDSGASWTQISTPSTTTYNCGKSVQYNGLVYIPCMSGQLQWNGIAFSVFTDPVYPRSNFRGVVLQDRWFLLENSTRNIRFSNVIDFGTWPSSNSIGFSAEDKDTLVGIIAYRDRLVTLRQNSINVIYLNGPPSSWIVKQLPFNIGVPNENCALVYNDLLYLLSYDGIYRTDLTQIEEISKPLAPAFRRRRLAVFGFFQKYQDCMGYYNGRIICSVITDTNKFRMFVFNIDNNTWTEWLPNIVGFDGYSWDPPKDLLSIQIGRRTGGPVYQREGVYYSTASTTGKIYFFDDQNPVYQDDTGFPISSIARTKATDADIPSQLKRSARFSVRAYKTGGAGNLTGLYSINGVDGPTFNVPIDGTTVRKQTRLKGPGWFRELAFEISDLSTNYIEIEDFVVSIRKKSDISEVAT